MYLLWAACFLYTIHADSAVPVLPVRGIPKYDWSNYASTHFSCDQGTKIERKMFNDDFCDCEDGSDEPGTSACADKGTLFFCHDGGQDSSVYTSQVNDGVCDCCDGSDEYDPPGKKSQCIDTCSQYDKDAYSRAVQKFKEGAMKLPEYLAKGGQKAFEGECYNIQSGVFEYEKCPYGNATQRDEAGSVLVGEWQGWADDNDTGPATVRSSGESKYIMRFGNGDMCGETPRALTVLLECGAEDEILSESEPSVCSYAMRMSSPLACDADEGQKLGLNANGDPLERTDLKEGDDKPDWGLFHSEL